MSGTRERRGIGALLAGLFRRSDALLPGQPFRVVLLLTPDRLPPGTNAGQATVALRRAILSLPGAEYLHVQPRPFISREEAWLSVSPPGSEGVMPRGPAWARKWAEVERVVLAALAGLTTPGVTEVSRPAHPVRVAQTMPGFAEASASALVPSGPTKRRPGRPRRADRIQPAEAVVPAGLALLEQLASSAMSPAPSPLAAVTPPIQDVEAEPGSDRALLTGLLGMAGRSGDDHGSLAGQLLARHGSYPAVLALSPRELLVEPGVNRHTAAGLKLVHAAALRLGRAEVAQAPVLEDPGVLVAYLTAVLARERIEQFRILFFDATHHLLADEAQARGTVNHTPVYPREVARRALELLAASLILVHNHPSGDPTPSREDVEMTALVRRACGVVGVEVRDHLIIGWQRGFSFREAGLMEDG